MKQFIKNILDTKVDNRRETITYKISAMYDVPVATEDGHVFYDIEQETIKKITLTWDEIDKLGGPGKIVEDLKKKYNIK